jgi:transcriptional regulator
MPARYDNTTQAFLIGLRVTGKNSYEIAALTGIPRQSIDAVYQRALKNGFDPDKRPLKIDDTLFAPMEGRSKSTTSSAKRKRIEQKIDSDEKE